MFFIFSKIFAVVIEPLIWSLALLAAAAFFLKRKSNAWALRCTLAALAILIVFSLPLVSHSLWSALERSAENTRKPTPYDICIVLGGTIDYDGFSAQETTFGDNVERLHAAYALAHDGHCQKLLITGDGPGNTSEAKLLSDVLVNWGIAPARLMLEEKARSTKENAQLSAAMLKEYPGASLLLITSAYHMPRAAKCFGSAGLYVDTYPVDYRARGNPKTFIVPSAESFHESTQALHEWVGRVAYSLSGC